MTGEDSSYALLRARWKPDPVRLLLIAESPPDSGAGPRRFFYDDDLTARDSLFRSVAKAVFDVERLPSGRGGKTAWLRRLKDRGVYLIDQAPVPVNMKHPRERAAILAANIEATVEQARELRPEGIIICKTNVFADLAGPLRHAGLPLLHDEPIPFPGSGWQKVFVERFRAAANRL